MEDMNAVLESHPGALVSHHVVVTGGGAMLLFVVDVLPKVSATPRDSAGEPRVDYREVLDSEQFALFSRLRSARKAWADAEGVPVYTVFTNAQLAEIVRLGVRTSEELGKVEGIGSGRAERYGARLLEILNGVGKSPKTP
jgi:superfamily II DNA helicase RecQ